MDNIMNKQSKSNNTQLKTTQEKNKVMKTFQELTVTASQFHQSKISVPPQKVFMDTSSSSLKNLDFNSFRYKGIPIDKKVNQRNNSPKSFSQTLKKLSNLRKQIETPYFLQEKSFSYKSMPKSIRIVSAIPREQTPQNDSQFIHQNEGFEFLQRKRITSVQNQMKRLTSAKSLKSQHQTYFQHQANQESLALIKQSIQKDEIIKDSLNEDLLNKSKQLDFHTINNTINQTLQQKNSTSMQKLQLKSKQFSPQLTQFLDYWQFDKKGRFKGNKSKKKIRYSHYIHNQSLIQQHYCNVIDHLKLFLLKLQRANINPNELINNKIITFKPFERDGSYSFFIALKSMNLDIVQAFIQKTKYHIFDLDFKFQIPLHKSVIKGDNEVTEYLLQQGSYVDHKDIHKKTPLDYALENQSYHIASMLLYYHASTNILFFKDCTQQIQDPMMIANLKAANLVKLLLKKSQVDHLDQIRKQFQNFILSKFYYKPVLCKN